MYWFIGLVAQDDVLKGNIEPSYILCTSHGTSEARTGFRVYRVNSFSSGTSPPKYIVPEVVGHEDIIDFLSSYRTRDHMHNSKYHTEEETKKYYPKGSLFWFECDKNGDRNKLSTCIFICNVPVKKTNMWTDGGKKRLEKYQNDISLKHLLTKANINTINLSEDVKIKCSLLDEKRRQKYLKEKKRNEKLV